MKLDFIQKINTKKNKEKLVKLENKIESLMQKIILDKSEKIVLEKDLMKEFKHYQKHAGKYAEKLLDNTKFSPYEIERNKYYTTIFYMKLLETKEVSKWIR